MDKIREVYDSYADIMEKVGLEKIDKRYKDLHQIYIEFIKKECVENKVRINTFVLAHAIMDYFTDITRLKDFHKIEYTNNYKTMAYEINWLLRRKPLQILEDEQESLIYINEKFVLSYTISFLTRNRENNTYCELGDFKQKVLAGFIESFYYHLKYRHCDAQSIELALLSFNAGITLNPNL